MFTINRDNEIRDYISEKDKLIPDIITNIISHIDYKINYIQECEFNIEKKKYLLITKEFTNKLLNILHPSNNYLVLSNKPSKWKLFNEEPLRIIFDNLKGIFMNTSEINYDKFNKKLLEYKESLREPLILINDSININLNKVKLNVPIFHILNSFSKINIMDYDKILINIDPYILELLYNSHLFGEKLRLEMEKFIYKTIMDGSYNYLIIDNKDLIDNKYSKIYYLKK